MTQAVDYLTRLLMHIVTSPQISNIQGDTEVEVEKLLKQIYAHLRKMDIPESARSMRIHEIVSFAFLKSLHSKIPQDNEIFETLMALLPPDKSGEDLKKFLSNIDIELFRVAGTNSASTITSLPEDRVKEEDVVESKSPLCDDILSILDDGRQRKYTVRSGTDLHHVRSCTYTYIDMKRRQRGTYPGRDPNRGLIYLPETHIVGSPWRLQGRGHMSWDDMEDRSMFDLILILTYFRELGYAVYRWACLPPADVEITVSESLDVEMQHWTYAIEKTLFMDNIIYGLGAISEDTATVRKELDDEMQIDEVAEQVSLKLKKQKLRMSEQIHSWDNIVEIYSKKASFKHNFHQNEYLVHVGSSNDSKAVPMCPFPKNSALLDAPQVHYPMKAYELMEYLKDTLREILFPPRRFFDAIVTAGFSYSVDFTFYHGGFSRNEEVIAKFKGVWDFEPSKKGLRRSKWWRRKPVHLANFQPNLIRYA